MDSLAAGELSKNELQLKRKFELLRRKKVCPAMSMADKYSF